MADPDRMWDLRMKFVEQAKKYFGVPYAKRYWNPDGKSIPWKTAMQINRSTYYFNLSRRFFITIGLESANITVDR